jgi:hypothetical protein
MISTRESNFGHLRNGKMKEYDCKIFTDIQNCASVSTVKNEKGAWTENVAFRCCIVTISYGFHSGVIFYTARRTRHDIRAERQMNPLTVCKAVSQRLQAHMASTVQCRTSEGTTTRDLIYENILQHSIQQIK